MRKVVNMSMFTRRNGYLRHVGLACQVQIPAEVAALLTLDTLVKGMDASSPPVYMIHLSSHLGANSRADWSLFTTSLGDEL